MLNSDETATAAPQSDLEWDLGDGKRPVEPVPPPESPVANSVTLAPAQPVEAPPDEGGSSLFLTLAFVVSSLAAMGAFGWLILRHARKTRPGVRTVPLPAMKASESGTSWARNFSPWTSDTTDDGWRSTAEEEAERPGPDHPRDVVGTAPTMPPWNAENPEDSSADANGMSSLELTAGAPAARPDAGAPDGTSPHAAEDAGDADELEPVLPDYAQTVFSAQPPPRELQEAPAPVGPPPVATPEDVSDFTAQVVAQLKASGALLSPRSPSGVDSPSDEPLTSRITPMLSTDENGMRPTPDEEQVGSDDELTSRFSSASPPASEPQAAESQPSARQPVGPHASEPRVVHASLVSEEAEWRSRFEEAVTARDAALSELSALRARQADYDRLQQQSTHAEVLLGDARQRLAQLEQDSHLQYAAVQGAMRTQEEAVRERDAALREKAMAARERDEALRLQNEWAAARELACREREAADLAREKALRASQEFQRERDQALQAGQAAEQARDELQSQVLRLQRDLEGLQAGGETAAAEGLVEWQARVADLEQQLRQQASEREALQAALLAARESLSELREDQARLATQHTREHEQFARQQDDWSEQVRRLHAQVAQDEQRWAAHQDRVQTYEQTISALQDELQLARDALLDERRQREAIEVALQDLQKASGVLAATEQAQAAWKQTTQDQLRHLEATIHEQQQTCSRLQLEKEESLERYYESLRQREALEAELQSLRQQLDASVVPGPELASLHQEADQLRLLNDTLQREQSHWETDHRETLDHLQSALQRAAAAEAALRETEAQLAVAQSDAELGVSCQAEIERLRERIRCAEQELHDARAGQLQLQAACAGAQEQLSDLQQQNLEVREEAEAERARAEAAESRAAAAEEAMQETEIRLQDREALEEKYRQLEEASAWLERDQEEATQKLAAAQTELGETRVRLHEAEQIRLRAEAELKAMIDVAARHRDAVTQQYASERDTAIKAWGRAEQRASDLQATVREHEVTLRQLENENDRLLHRVEELQTYRSHLDQALEAAESGKADGEWQRAWRDSRAQLETEIVQLRESLQGEQLRHEQASARLREAHDRIQALEVSAAQRERDLAQLANERAALQADLDQRADAGAVTESMAFAEQRLNEAEQTMLALRQVLQEQEAELTVAQREKLELDAQLTAAKTERRSLTSTVRQLEKKLSESQQQAEHQIQQMRESLDKSESLLAEQRSALAAAERKVKQLEKHLPAQMADDELSSTGRKTKQKSAKTPKGTSAKKSVSRQTDDTDAAATVDDAPPEAESTEKKKSRGKRKKSS